MSAEELDAVNKLKVVELKAQLSSFGLPTSGLKADLAARLKEYLVTQAASKEAEEDEPTDAEQIESAESPSDYPIQSEQPSQGDADEANEAISPRETTSVSLKQESSSTGTVVVPTSDKLEKETKASNEGVVSNEDEPLNTRSSRGSPNSMCEGSQEDLVECKSPPPSETPSSGNTRRVCKEGIQDEIVRKNLDMLEKEEKVSEGGDRFKDVKTEKEVVFPEKKLNETKNQKKKRRKKTRKILKRIEERDIGSDGGSRTDHDDREDVQVDYVPDQVEKDLSWFQFANVFEKFRFVDPEGTTNAGKSEPTDPFFERLFERKKPADIGEDDEEEEPKEDAQIPKLSKKKLKQLTRMSVAELKIRVNHPELVEMHDVTTRDPVFLLTLKATRNSVPVPRHWCFKRKYLQGKRGIEKPPFDLPHFIKRTGICEMRAALQEKEEAKTLKSKQREKIRPKMGKIDIDYQKLHDAFFKWQTKPRLCIHGDLYYEGKEFETRLKEKKPGDLSEELRTALGMPTGPNAVKCPPPWLIAMQRYGPPPSYPNQKIPGLNAPIPEGCSFGYHAGGWGKPPVDETGKPLYGDVFGVTATENGISSLDQDIDKNYLFGALEEEESEEEEQESEEDEEAEESGEEEPDESGLTTPAEGLQTPSGFQSSVSQNLDIPDAIELRKKKIESEMEMGDQVPQLYQVLAEKKTERVGHAMMGSVHTYEIPNQTTGSSKKGGVELALDPSELEMDPGAMAARYEQTVREQQNQLAKEDFSDMVAEHAAKQKNKRKAREEAGAGGKKKYKEFKF